MREDGYVVLSDLINAPGNSAEKGKNFSLPVNLWLRQPRLDLIKELLWP